MTFLHLGLAAAGIACVAIPILIHLLMRRRRKPVMWGAMRFLLEAYRRQRRRLMLEQWLLLAARCLLVLLLGLAIARPLLRGLGPAPGGRTVYVLIDNGLASTATTGRAGADEDALARHKQAAERVLAQLAAGASAEVGDRVALITLGGPADPLVVPPSGDIDAVRRLIGAVTATDSRTDVAGALSVVASSMAADHEREAGAARGRTVVVILSDFLEGSAELDGALPKLPDGATVIATTPPEGRSLENLAIAGVEPLRSLVVAGTGEGSAAGGEQVRVTVRRSGAAAAQAGVVSVRVRVSRPGQAEGAAGAFSGSGRGVVRFAAGQEEASGVVPVSITTTGGAADAGADERAGPALLEATLDADAIGGDNLWRRPVEVRRTLRVGIVALRRFGDAGRIDELPAAEWLKLALRPADDAALADAGAVDIAEIEPGALDAGRLARLDALILPRPELLSEDMWRRVRAFVDAGGLIMVMPPADITVHAWADVMARTLGVPWTLAREAAPISDPVNQDHPRIVAAPAAGGEAAGAADVLALLRPELADLLGGVAVFRAVPMIFPEGERAATGASERILMIENGPVVLWAGPPREAEGEGNIPAGAQQQAGRGLVVYLGAALDLSWTNLPARPLMVPLVQELVRQGIGRARGSWWGTAGRQAPAPRRAVELVRLEQRQRPQSGVAPEEAAGPAVLRVDDTGATAEPVRHAGVWRAVDDRGGERGVVAVNPDARAGAVNQQAAPDVERWLRTSAGATGEVAMLSEDQFGRPDPAGGPSSAGASPLAALLSGEDSGPPISLPLLIAAAALALIEIVLARWASHAEAGPTPALQGAAA